MKFAEVKSMKKIQRLFRGKFFPKNLRKFPDIRAFYRDIERYEEEGTSHPLIPADISHEGDALHDWRDQNGGHFEHLLQWKQMFSTNAMLRKYL